MYALDEDEIVITLFKIILLIEYNTFNGKMPLLTI
jgi:hypothetical protein